jgi:hypothetical protein
MVLKISSFFPSSPHTTQKSHYFALLPLSSKHNHPRLSELTLFYTPFTSIKISCLPTPHLVFLSKAAATHVTDTPSVKSQTGVTDATTSVPRAASIANKGTTLAALLTSPTVTLHPVALSLEGTPVASESFTMSARRILIALTKICALEAWKDLVVI